MRPENARTGLRVLAQSLGNAVRRALQRPRPAAGEPSAVLGRLLLGKRRVEQEIRKLEAELERVHSRITSQPLPSDPTDQATAAQFDLLVRRARQIRDRIQEKRDQLLRIERHLARERWLRTQERRSVAEAAKPPSTARRAKPRRPSALRKVLNKISLDDQSALAEVRRLGEDFSSNDPDVRRRACARLGNVDSANARKLLLMALDDPNQRVQLAALNALSGARSRAAVAAFRRFLSHRSAPLRLAALRGLASIDARLLGEAETAAALKDADASVRRAAATIMGWRRERRARDPQAYQALTLALHDRDPTVRVAAVEALGSLGDHRAVFSLIACLADHAEPVRESAEQSLRVVIGSALDTVGGGLTGEERVAALKQWWRSARVEVALGRSPAIEERPAKAPVAPAAPVESAPPETPRSEAAPPEAEAIAAAPVPDIDALLPVETIDEEAAADAAGDAGEGGDFENIFGDVGAEAGALDEGAQSAEAEPEPVPEPVPDAEAEDGEAGAEGEEYENIFGSEDE